MPLPLAHSLTGAALWAALDERADPSAAGRLAAAVVIANAPDLDLVPGVLLGDPNRFHHGPTHSLLTALALGLAVGWLGRSRLRWPLARGTLGGWTGTAVMVAALWASHVALDMVTRDPSSPMGVPALWPLMDARFHVADLFERADKVAGPASPAEFVRSLLSAHNGRALVREALLTGPLLGVALWWRRRLASTGRST